MNFLAGNFSACECEKERMVKFFSIRKKDRKKILLLTIGEGQVEEGYCSTFLSACRRGSVHQCVEKVRRLFEKTLEVTDFAGAMLFCMEEECVYAWTEGFSISLFRFAFNRPCTRPLSTEGRGVACAVMEAGIGLLMCHTGLYRLISEEELIQCLFTSHFDTGEQLARHIKEVALQTGSPQGLQLAYVSVREDRDREGSLKQSGYHSVRLVGEGAFGKVYCGTKKGQTHAIKFAEGSQAVRLLKREAAILERIQHSAFPQFISFTEEDGTGRLVMEYVRGRELQSFLAGRQQSFAKRAGIAIGIADAIRYLHGLPEGILYRDLKPANIMVERSGKVKMIDLGSACLLSESNRSYAGSAGYMAPEAEKREQVGTWSDVYSFGKLCGILFRGMVVPESLSDWIAQSTTEKPQDRPSFETFPLTFSKEGNILVNSIKVDY